MKFKAATLPNKTSLKKAKKEIDDSEFFKNKLNAKELSDIKKSAMVSAPRMTVSMPYILNIKNNSYDNIKEFSLNNLEQALKSGKTYDDRVEVTYSLMNYTYLQFLQGLNVKSPVIGKIRIEAFHDYPKYREIQLGKALAFCVNNSNGSSSVSPIIQFIKLNQFFLHAVESDVDIRLVDGWDLKFQLMPEAEIRIFLYPSEVLSEKFLAPKTLVEQKIYL